MRKCKFLSSSLSIPPADEKQNIEKYVEIQNNKFINDFVKNKTYFRGKPIIVTHDKDSNDYGSILNQPKYKLTAFAHIVSNKINKNSKKRELDIRRLKTCHWVKEIVEKYNQNDPQCINCRLVHIKDAIEHNCEVTYIYCENVRYVIILQKAYNYMLPKDSEEYEYYFIKSAFYVNEQNMHISILKKF